MLREVFALQFILFEANLLQIRWWWNKQTCCVNCQRWNHPTCSFPRFSFRTDSSEPGSAPAWTLLSLTSAVISHGYWLTNNDRLSGRLSAEQNTVLSELIGKHIFALQHIKHCSRLPLQGIMGIWVPCHRGDRSAGAGGPWQQAAQIWDLRLTWKTIATREVGPEAQRPRSSPSQYFSMLFFTLLSQLSCSAFLSLLEDREGEGHLPRGRIIHCPWSQRKQSQIQRQRSLPFSTVPHYPESHISAWNAPSLTHPAPPPADRDGSKWATVGYLQKEELCFYLSDSQDVRGRQRISSARAGGNPRHC